jgi:hypothetical protein
VRYPALTVESVDVTRYTFKDGLVFSTELTGDACSIRRNL